jgi:hypothetical protein
VFTWSGVPFIGAVFCVMTGGLALASQDLEPRTWSIAYADGRVVTTPLRQHGGMWTPMFPKRTDASIAAGEAAHLLDVRYVTEAADVVATISLATERFRQRVTVAVVRVPYGTSVRVEQLAEYGVEPITLTVGTLDPVQAYAPVAEEPSGQLVVNVEPIRPTVPIYRFAVRNLSARALRSFDWEAYQGDRRILSGRRKTERNEPLIVAGDEFAFEMPLSSREEEAWQTVDRIALTSVVWEDGTVDGNPEPAERERAMALNRVSELKRVVEVLTSGAGKDFNAVRQAFASLDPTDYAIENARGHELEELKLLEHATAKHLNEWVRTKAVDYATWLERCERAARPLQLKPR